MKVTQIHLLRQESVKTKCSLFVALLYFSEKLSRSTLDTFRWLDHLSEISKTGEFLTEIERKAPQRERVTRKLKTVLVQTRTRNKATLY